MAPTIGDVRKAVATLGDKAWKVPAELPDDAPIPDYATGGDLSRLKPANQVPPVNLANLVAAQSANPFLLQRRANLGLTAPPRLAALPTGFAVEDAKQRPPSVDWRGRWGVNRRPSPARSRGLRPVEGGRRRSPSGRARRRGLRVARPRYWPHVNES